MKHRGCVMEIRQKTMVLMTEECSFVEVKKPFNVIEGMEIEFTSKDIVSNSRKQYKSLVSIAAAIVFILISSFSVINYWQTNLKPVILLTVDINPSIEVELNEKQAVVSITPLNEEARQILANSNFKRKPIEEVIEIIVERAEEAGYISKEEENLILITSVSLDEEEEGETVSRQLLENLKDSVEELGQSKGERITVVTAEANKEQCKKSKEDKTSVGRVFIKEDTEKEDNPTEEKEWKKRHLKEVLKEVSKEHPVFKQNPGLINHPIFRGRNIDEEDEIEIDEGKKDKKDKKDRNSSNSDNEDDDDVKDEKAKGNKGNGNKDQKHPVFEEHPSNGNRDNRSDEKDHENDDDKDDDENDDENDQRGRGNRDSEDQEHPVFEKHPSNGNSGNRGNESDSEDQDKDDEENRTDDEMEDDNEDVEDEDKESDEDDDEDDKDDDEDDDEEDHSVEDDDIDLGKGNSDKAKGRDREEGNKTP
ncbi:anti-sigma factor domain-containing protein [Alkaliphilus serpentinus]|uniref:anti-sigma factor domain-containing protein n=1 Tax=Alkaliphilus serpentinus TaxID=1482731 RepID=UPI0018657926|nr:anti-sigma factor domain-containing protein [Alkaliphilus serpentinus]